MRDISRKYNLYIFVLSFIGILLFAMSLLSIDFYMYLARFVGLSRHHIYSEKFFNVILSMKKRLFISGIFLIVLNFILFKFRNKILKSKIMDTIKSPWAESIGFKALIKELLWFPVEKKDYLFLFLLIIYIGLRVFFIENRPITIDESFTLYGYSAKSFWYAMTSLTAANNHLFNTFFIYFTYKLLGDSIWAVRFAPFIVSVIFIIIYYTVVSKLFNRYSALISSALLTVAPVMINFSSLGRGYIYISLFEIISFYYLLKVGRGERGYIIPLAIVMALGFFSMPIFMYVFLALLLFYIRYFKEIRKILYSSVASIVFTGLLYLPAYVISGDKMFFASFSKMKVYGLSGIYRYLVKLIYYFSSNFMVSEWVFLVLIATTFIYAYFKRDRLILYLYMLILSFLLFSFLIEPPYYRILLMIVLPILSIFIANFIVLSGNKYLFYFLFACIVTRGVYVISSEPELVMGRHSFYYDSNVIEAGLQIAKIEKKKVFAPAYEILKFYSMEYFNDTLNTGKKWEKLSDGDLLILRTWDKKISWSRMFKDYPLIKKQNNLELNKIYRVDRTYLYKVKIR